MGRLAFQAGFPLWLGEEGLGPVSLCGPQLYVSFSRLVRNILGPGSET